MEIEQLKAQKRALKGELKSGRIDNITYQKQFTPFTNRIRDLEFRIDCFKLGKVKEAFPNETDLTFNLIEQYIQSTKKTAITKPINNTTHKSAPQNIHCLKSVPKSI
ncbi:MAG: hypothetical protein ACI30R_05995 [Sodaliphilus sp.]